MKKLLDLMEGEIKKAFEEAGFDPAYAKVVLSNRPDLCEYQCNGAMAAAKAYKKKPSILQIRWWEFFRKEAGCSLRFRR